MTYRAIRDGNNVWLLDRPRGLLLSVISMLFLFSAALSRNAVGEEPTRPNIVMAFADDWGRFASCYANETYPSQNDASSIENRNSLRAICKQVSTPNFDRVAAEGMLFLNAFVNAPSCTPCRSSLLTGQHFWRCKSASILQGARWDNSLLAYPLLLEQSGYHIGHTYKVWSPGTTPDQPHGGARTRFAKEGGRLNRYSQTVAKASADARAEVHRAIMQEVRANIESFLDQVPEGKPFCYWFGPTNVHRTWVAGSGKSLWGIDPDSLQGKMPPYWPDVDIIRQDLADYLGEVQAWDAALGILIGVLEERGHFDDTLLVVSGDHGIPGFPCGKCDLYDTGTQVPMAIRWPGKIEPGLVSDALVSLPDLAPTFCSVAGVATPQEMTALSLAELWEQNADQPSRVAERAAVFFGRERHVAEAREAYLPYPMRGIRTKDFLYIINFEPTRWPMGSSPGYDTEYSEEMGLVEILEKDLYPTYDAFLSNTRAGFADVDAGPTKAWICSNLDDPMARDAFARMVGKRPAEELYDLRNDVHQMHNVAIAKEYAEIKSELRDRLTTELARTGDPRWLEGGKPFETPPLAGPPSKNK